MVNPASRLRREVETLAEKPAVLDNHRLTFSTGGATNVIRKLGWSVHGVVMECKTEADWERLLDFDAGYDYVERDVLPYGSEETIRARIFVMDGNEAENAKLPINRLPQERYIRIVAEGMKFHGVDQDIIDFHIMNVPYIPSREPNDYLRFHSDLLTKKRTKMKTISYDEYLLKSEKNSWIAIGERVIQVRQINEHNSGSARCLQWVQQNLVGKYDSTQFLLQAHYDPDLLSHENGVTNTHRAWAENLLAEKFEQGDLTGRLVCLLKDVIPKRRSRRLSSLVLPRQMSFWRKGSGSNELEQFLCDATESGDSRTTLANSARSSIVGD